MDALPSELLHGVTGYADLADRLKHAITEGQLAAGARLPSQRILSYRLGLAVGTVTRAYTLLERDGYVDSYVGRGTFVAMRGGGFGNGFAPTVPTRDINLSLDLPLEHMNPPLDGVLADIAAGAGNTDYLAYATPEIDRRHTETGVQWVRQFGMQARAEQVLPVMGAQHGLFTALATACRPGDTVVCETLTYPGFLGAARLLGLRLEAAALDGQGIMPRAVEEICRRQTVKALYLTPTIQNPTTGQLGLKRREALAELARRHDFAIIEDELKPRFLAPAPDPVAMLAPERTFFIAGLSKLIGGGCRASFMVVPEHHLVAAETNRWAAIWRVSTIALEIACRLLETGVAERVAREKEDEAARRRQLADRHLGQFDLRSATGSTYAWLNLPAGWSNATALAALKEEGIAVSAADSFWAGHTPPPNAIRLCLGGVASRELLSDALARIACLLGDVPQVTRL